MTDPVRLLDGQRGLARDLLRSGLTDAAPEAARAHVLNAVSDALTSGTAIHSRASSAHRVGASTSTGSNAALAPAITTRFALVLGSASPKLVSLGLAAAVSLAGVAYYAVGDDGREDAPPASPPSELPPRALAAPASDDVKSTEEAARVGDGTLELTPREVPMSVGASRSKAPAAPTRAARTAPARDQSSQVPAAPNLDDARPKAPDDDLDEQLALLARARQALQASRPGAALERLAEYERRFAKGALAPEAFVLRQRAKRQLAASTERRSQ